MAPLAQATYVNQISTYLVLVDVKTTPSAPGPRLFDAQEFLAPDVRIQKDAPSQTVAR